MILNLKCTYTHTEFPEMLVYNIIVTPAHSSTQTTFSVGCWMLYLIIFSEFAQSITISAYARSALKVCKNTPVCVVVIKFECK